MEEEEEAEEGSIWYSQRSWVWPPAFTQAVSSQLPEIQWPLLAFTSTALKYTNTHTNICMPSKENLFITLILCTGLGVSISEHVCSGLDTPVLCGVPRTELRLLGLAVSAFTC